MLHKPPTYRHPETKGRAVLFPVSGTRGSVGVMFFDYRQRYASRETVHPCARDARDSVTAAGYLIEESGSRHALT